MPPSVLIVEDDPLTQRSLEHLLAPHVQRGALDLRFASSAEGARGAIAERPAQVVVCDLYLPKKDGFTLGEELKKACGARVILMGAGHIEPMVRHRALRKLDAPVYSKPLELPDLVAALVSDPGAQEAPVMRAESGSLAGHGSARLLLDAWEERRSGELVLVRGRVRKAVTLRRGAPVAVASNLRNETLGHFLVQRRRITDAQHQEALGVAQREGARLGRVLVRMGALTERQLLDELAAQLRHKLTATLRWPDGEFRFDPGEPAGDRLELPFETPRLVFSGLRRTARLDEIVPRLRKQPARVGLGFRAERHRATLVKVFGAEGLLLLDKRPLVAELIAHRDARNVLVLTDALLRVGAAELEPLGADAQATPARDPLALVELGRVRPDDAPPRLDGDSLFVDPDPAFEGVASNITAVDTELEDSGVFPLPSAADADDEGPSDANTEALRREVLSEYLSLHAKDHYALLGVARTATLAEIGLAHAALARRFRFERFAAVELGRDYARLEEIVARVRAAHETLTSSERRARYDATLPAPSEFALNPLDAEVMAHDGCEKLARGDLAGAGERLARAVELDPDQPDYHALLGWAAYLHALGPGRESAGQPRVEAAAQLAQPHLATALQIDPDHLDAHEFLGRIDAARGRDADAADHLELVLDEAPTRAEALTALEAALGRRGEWRRLENVYRRLVHRLADDSTERPILIWLRLAELYWKRLGDRSAAVIAYGLVARRDPDDPRPRRALAELLADDEQAWPEAVQALRESWRIEPEDPAPGRALFQAHLRGERWDAALVSSGALACRGALDEESAAFLRQHRPRFLVRAQDVVSPLMFDSLRHPDDERPLAELFADVFAVSVPEVPLEVLGVSAADALPQDSVPDPLARALAYAAQLLGVHVPQIYVRADFGAEIHVGASRPHVLFVGPEAVASSDLFALAFRAGRALSYLRPGRALAGALPANDLKEHLGAALTLAHPGMRFDDPDGRVSALRVRLSGRATSLAQTLRPHADALLAAHRPRVHLGRFVRGLARTADRIGLVTCNDLPTAARIVAGEYAAGAEDELIDFALGDDYLATRAHLGLSLAV